MAINTELENALRERDAYFTALAEAQEDIAAIIPALEKASGLKADTFRPLAVSTTENQWAVLCMARAIMESA